MERNIKYERQMGTFLELYKIKYFWRKKETNKQTNRQTDKQKNISSRSFKEKKKYRKKNI